MSLAEPLITRGIMFSLMIMRMYFTVNLDT
jgi:hypothetical protein